MPPKKATTTAAKKTAAGPTHASYRGMYSLILLHHHFASW
jgi:hypothetical protein